ncbi:LysR family transcriptional regulator [Bradyrhizobium commune]|uniref:LysR family transcriptional regulator n=1 Tax=Bradyrhizobium commune TaxID=83627 RepID=A0A7S9GY45_9BRAD|nr:LysR family transcriptional regulator [Bradyrhizobium commune]QPF90194.1 LysR family transcriptional regulator [Bradyrhizobium commune]
MKLHDLHVLMAVVQAGSMGKAALMLDTTQPNVSRAIAELERTFGVRLLDRHRRGIEPTECGRALLDCGTAVFDELRRGVKSIEFLADPTAGEVRIGSTAFLAASLVSALVDRLSRRHPRIKFQLVTGYIEALHRDLSERKVDLLFVRSGGPIADERLHFEFLFEERYVVAAGAKNPWTRRRKIQLPDLADERWVLPPRESVIGSIITHAFLARGLEYPRATVVTDSPHMRVSLLETGRFITVFPASALKFLTRGAALKVLPVELPAARRPNGMVTVRDRAVSPLVQLVMDSARELAKPMAKRT